MVAFSAGEGGGLQAGWDQAGGRRLGPPCRPRGTGWGALRHDLCLGPAFCPRLPLPRHVMPFLSPVMASSPQGDRARAAGTQACLLPSDRAPCLVLPPRVSEGKLPTLMPGLTWLSLCAKSLAWLDPQPTPSHVEHLSVRNPGS